MIREFMGALAEDEPDAIYPTYRRCDSRVFLHFMAFADEEAEERHRNAPYTFRFVEKLYPKRGMKPVFESLMPMS